MAAEIKAQICIGTFIFIKCEIIYEFHQVNWNAISLEKVKMVKIDCIENNKKPWFWFTYWEIYVIYFYRKNQSKFGVDTILQTLMVVKNV